MIADIAVISSQKTENTVKSTIQETLQNVVQLMRRYSFDRALSLVDDAYMQTKWRYFLRTMGNTEKDFLMVINGRDSVSYICAILC